ncbi:MAG: hypothetical protein RIS42_630 [Bacteroidota bacterium]|jgi:hypothetical protein
MRHITWLFIFISVTYFSCKNNEIENHILEPNLESQDLYVERNVRLIQNLKSYILKNQELLLSNRLIIDSVYGNSIFQFLKNKQSENSEFEDLINQMNRSRFLNLKFNKYHSNYTDINRVILAKLSLNENNVAIGLNEFGDRKSCLILYNQNISDCHSSFYREAAVAVLAAGLGGFWGGIVPAFDAAWGLIDCQNRAQRNFDYCLGNI